MHNLIERNIGTLFPGLKLLETEFREMTRGELRPDTIAFDTTLDTFVALEYKNRLNKEAVDQARTYLSSMRQHQAELVLSHSNNMKCRPRDQKSFKWKKMYAIIMAPEFGHYQVFGADEDPNVELYEISMYDDRIMLVERVGGGHERQDTPAAITREQPTGQQNKAVTPLTAIQYQKGMKCEGWLTRNGERKTKVNSWVGLLVAVMNEVNPQKPIKRGVRWLVNPTPQHDNGKKFFAPKRLSNGMWLETGSKGPPYILEICNGFPVAKELGLELH